MDFGKYYCSSDVEQWRGKEEEKWLIDYNENDDNPKYINFKKFFFSFFVVVFSKSSITRCLSSMAWASNEAYVK